MGCILCKYSDFKNEGAFIYNMWTLLEKIKYIYINNNVHCVYPGKLKNNDI